MARTLLIGLDGGTFMILDPLMEQGVMPTLKSVIQNGVRAELLSTPNPLTPPAWVSVMTGRSPGNHGVFDFVRVVEHENGCYMNLINALDVRCETIWSVVSRNGQSATSLNFVAMNPPRPIKGHVIPGYMTAGTLKFNVYPPGLLAKLRALPGFSVNDITWDLEAGRKADLYQLSDEQFESFIRYHIKADRQWLNVLRHLMATEPSELAGIVFDGVDRLQHVAWRFLDPKYFPENPSPSESHFRRLCLEYFRELDGFLSEIVRIAGPDGRVFILSDHGFGPSHEIFYANTWLHENGYLYWKEGVPRDDSGAQIPDTSRGYLASVDWNRTTAYVQTPNSNGIHIRIAEKPGQPGVSPRDYHSFRNRLASRLSDYRDPATGEQVVAKIQIREEIFSGPYAEQAPDLTLTLRDHNWGSVSVLNAPNALRQRPKVVGTHRPEGVFIAAGSGIRKGLNLLPTSILNVAPLVLHSCEIPIPEDLEGDVVTYIYEDAFLRALPVRRGTPATPAERKPKDRGEAGLAPEDQAQVLERLKGLGYLE